MLCSFSDGGSGDYVVSEQAHQGGQQGACFSAIDSLDHGASKRCAGLRHRREFAA